MHISLTSELEQYVHDKVESESYSSTSEVVRDSLRLLHEQEDLQKQKLREAIELGLADIEAGRFVSGEVVLKSLRKKIKALEAKEKKR